MRWPLALAACSALACGKDAVSTERRVPTLLVFSTGAPPSATVGSEAGPLTVVVSDDRGPIPGVRVGFAVSQGFGRVEPAVVTTAADGSASVDIVVGTVPGQNEITAVVDGLAPMRSPLILGVAGPTDTLTLATRAVRLSAAQDSVVIGAVARDAYLNANGQPVSWVSRNPALVGVTTNTNGSGVARVASRPGQTHLVVTSGAVTDSVRVTVHDASSTPCSFIASPVTLAVGESIELAGGTPACLRAEDPGAEFGLVAHYNTGVVNARVVFEIGTNGIVAPATMLPLATSQIEGAATTFEYDLRRREADGMRGREPGARRWRESRAEATIASVTEGELLQLNVNAFEFCANPRMRAGRVVAISNSAIIIADTSNPPGGFTDAEYRVFGAMMDTLVVPVDTMAFGAPSDIDQNNRVAVFFTSAVNALTPRGGQGAVALGFFYSRDLLPRQSAAGQCPGSNVGEMFYLIVPDPDGVASDARSKEFVGTAAPPTIAHEYQHLISASRRMYVTQAPETSEEIWLNEGLSHVAEELLFYRVSGLTPRQNIGATQLQDGSALRGVFDAFQRDNFGRYQQYLRAPESSSPLAANDLIATRGATWAFLRYLADRAGPTDGSIWRRIVDSRVAGTRSLDAVLADAGTSTLAALSDWSVAVFADDNPLSSAFQQRSWDFVGGMPAAGMSFTLAPSSLVNGTNGGIAVRSGGTFYGRFAIPQQQEATIQVGGPGGGLLPHGIRLTVVRTQ